MQVTSRVLRSLRRPLAATAVRNYVVPMKELNFLIKDVLKIPQHYARLGYDPQVKHFAYFIYKYANNYDGTSWTSAGLWRGNC